MLIGSVANEALNASLDLGTDPLICSHLVVCCVRRIESYCFVYVISIFVVTSMNFLISSYQIGPFLNFKFWNITCVPEYMVR